MYAREREMDIEWGIFEKNNSHVYTFTHTLYTKHSCTPNHTWNSKQPNQIFSLGSNLLYKSIFNRGGFYFSSENSTNTKETTKFFFY